MPIVSPTGVQEVLILTESTTTDEIMERARLPFTIRGFGRVKVANALEAGRTAWGDGPNAETARG